VASYSAVIDLRVQGQEGLRTVSDRIETINRLIKQIKPVPTLFDARAGAEITDAKNKLSALLKAYADGNTTVAKYSRSLAGLNQQMNSFRTIMANSTVNSDEFNNSLKAGEIASRKLLDAELDRLAALRNMYTRQATGGLTANDQGPSKMVNDLLSLNKKLPGSIAGLNAFQRELLEVQQLVSMNSVDFRELEQAIYKVDVALGKVQFGPTAPPMQGPELPANFIPGGSKTKAPAKGLAGFLGKPGVTDAMMGAGFPLLFGAGPGAILGGGGGGFLGGAMGAAGGPAGMALGIALSAVGQILDQTFVKIADLSKAADMLNVDGLRDSVIVVNAELEYQVGLLKQAGEADQARALIAKAVFEQTGLTAGATERIANTSNLLGNAWDGVTGAVGGFVSILASGVIPALLPVLKVVELVFKGLNMIITIVQDLAGAVGKWAMELVLGKELTEKILNSFKGTNEEAEKVKAALAKANDEQAKVTKRAEESLAIEKMRTNNVSLMGKLINVEADRKDKINDAENAAADKRKAALEEFAGVTSAAGKAKLADLLQEIDGEKKVAVEKANILALRQRELAINANLVEQDKGRISLLQMQGEIEKARETATSQVLATQIQELEQRKQIAGTLTGELGLIDAIAAKKKQSAADAFAAAQRDAALQVQIAADELASIERAKLRGQADELNVQQALRKYNTAVATTQENLRGAAAMQQGDAAAAEIEKRLQTVATYTEQYASAAGRATNSLNEAAAAVQNQASYSQALYQAQTTLNNIQIQSLQTALSTTKDTAKRAEIIDQIKDLEIANAQITYQSTVNQIQTQVELLRISYKQLEVEYLRLQAITDIARAQGVVKQGHLDALAAQESALRIAAGNLETATKTGNVNIQVAAAVRNAAIGAAELRAQTQGAAEAAGQYAGSMQNAATAMRAVNASKTVGFIPAEGSVTPAFAGAGGIKDEAVRKQMMERFNQIGANAKSMTIYQNDINKFAAEVQRIIRQENIPTFPTPNLNSLRVTMAENAERLRMQTAQTAAAASSPSNISPQINVTTGPVMQQNGTNYVTVVDMEKSMQTVVNSLLSNGRTAGGRHFAGIR
jgi:hypothetical protein